MGLLAQATQVAIQPQPDAQTACCVYDTHSNCTHNGQITFIGTTINSWNGYLTCPAYGTLSQGFMLRLNVPNIGQVVSCEFVRPAHRKSSIRHIPGIPGGTPADRMVSEVHTIASSLSHSQISVP